MTDLHDGGRAGPGRGDTASDGGRTGRRATFAERKERRAAVDDPTIVLEAAARFLEPRARSVAEVRRRLTGAGYRTDLVEGAITRMLDLGMLDDEAFARAWIEIARPGAAARRTGDPPGTRSQGRRPVDGRSRARRTSRGGRRAVADDDDGVTRSRRTRRRPSDSSPGTPGAWRASPTRASAASARTRSWPATASIPTCAGLVAAGVDAVGDGRADHGD